MSSTPQQADDDWGLVRRYLDGDESSLGALYNKHHSHLLSVLWNRGAKKEDAEEVASRVWADCVADRESHPSLLEKFSGKCPFRSWISTVATNRWYDIARRKGRFEGELPRNADENEDEFDRVPDREAGKTETALTRLLHECVQAAFAQCEAETIVMLRLVYHHGFAQREVGELWRCSEATVSRHLSSAMQDIRNVTLKLLKQKDAQLRLEWEDFVDLCAVFRWD